MELKKEHNWSEAELDAALTLSEEGTGFGLHSAGKLVLACILIRAQRLFYCSLSTRRLVARLPRTS